MRYAPRYKRPEKPTLSNELQRLQANTSNARYLAIIKRLLKAGTRPDLPANDGMTAINIARSMGWTEAEHVLVTQHAEFDTEAQQHAASVAATAGRPGTRWQGLVAIPAVLNRASLARDEDAWKHYGTSRQRFYEWKALLNGGQQLLSDMLTQQPTQQRVLSNQRLSLCRTMSWSRKACSHRSIMLSL